MSAEDFDPNDPMAFIRSHQEQHRMANEVVGHQIKDFMTSLDEEQLRTLILVIEGIMDSDKPGKIGGYLVGRAASILEAKFGNCAACGGKHEDASSLVDAEPSTVPEHVLARRKLDEAGDYTPIGSTLELDPAEKAIMEIYGLDDLREQDTFKLVAFVCLGCGQQYPSISDRMMQPPGVEGCSGCQQKAKFG